MTREKKQDNSLAPKVTEKLSPFRFADARVVLTGAASGMGQQMAHQLADQGARLVLVDRDEERLTAVAEAIAEVRPGSDVTTHIVNLSSFFALTGPAGQTAYSTSKFGLRGFSDSLRRELAPQGIGVTTVHPGGIRTRIAETARITEKATEEQVTEGKKAFARMLSYPADKAAAEILDGVARRRARVLIAPETTIIDIAARIAPVRNLELVSALQSRVGKVVRTLKRVRSGGGSRNGGGR